MKQLSRARSDLSAIGMLGGDHVAWPTARRRRLPWRIASDLIMVAETILLAGSGLIVLLAWAASSDAGGPTIPWADSEVRHLLVVMFLVCFLYWHQVRSHPEQAFASAGSRRLVIR